MNHPKVQYIECGCCGHFHTPQFQGDCRNDSNRFTADQLDTKHGANGWDFLDIEAQMEKEGET